MLSLVMYKSRLGAPYVTTSSKANTKSTELNSESIVNRSDSGTNGLVLPLFSLTVSSLSVPTKSKSPYFLAVRKYSMCPM